MNNDVAQLNNMLVNELSKLGYSPRYSKAGIIILGKGDKRGS